MVYMNFALWLWTFVQVIKESLSQQQDLVQISSYVSTQPCHFIFALARSTRNVGIVLPLFYYFPKLYESYEYTEIYTGSQCVKMCGFACLYVYAKENFVRNSS